MTALAADRLTARREGDRFSYPMAGSVTGYKGAIAVLDASGNLKPGVVATGLTAVGIFVEQVTNGSTAAAVNGTVEPGIFRFGNSSSTDAITKAEIGDTCYIVDDQTVAKTDGSSARSAAGKIVDVDSVGVWVKIGL